MKYLIPILIALIVSACAHRPNLQYDCELVGKEPKSGKMLSSCQ